MKHLPWIPLSAASALAVGLVAFALAASAMAEPEIGPPPQDGPRPPHGPHHPPHDPLRRALDADGDHVISSEEIANAASALKTLDKNGDGKLDREEMRPELPPWMHRRPGPPEGRGEFRGAPGPDGPRAEGPKPERFVDRLMEFDADSDGKLDRSELMVAAEKMAARRRDFQEKMGRWTGDRRRPAPPAP